VKLSARLEDQVIVVTQDGGFGPDSKIILRSIAQGSRCIQGTTWVYPYSSGAVLGLIEAADFLGADLKLDKPLHQAKTAADNQTAQEHAVRKLIQKYIDDPSLPVSPYTTTNNPPPWRHQMLTYHWGLRVPSLYVAHKPGLGKTREGADLIRARIDLGHVRPPEQFWVDAHWSDVHPDRPIEGHWATRGGVLVVCPRVVLGTWQEELWRFQGIEAAVLYSGSRRVKFRRAGIPAHVHIINYRSLEAVEDNEYDGIIADEAHMLANEETKQFARMAHIRNKAQWAIAMSGTPVSNMLPSLWSQYYWLDGGRTLGASFEDYRRRYFHGTGRSLEAKEGAEEAISHRISRVTYFLTMQQAFPDKPRKISQIYRVPMTKEQLSYYERVRSQAEADILTGTVSTEHINIKLLKLLQICQGFIIDDDKKVQTFTSAKLKALQDMITGSGDLTDRRTIIWCRFRHDLHQVSHMLQRYHIQHMTMHGDTKDREYLRDVWNHDHRYRVFVGMIQMGIGINLHAPNCVDDTGRPARCSTTVFYGLDWRVTQLEQAMDRIYRGDQVESCLYRYILSDDLDHSYGEDGCTTPIDMRVYNSLQVKLEQAHMISEESMEYVRRLVA